MTSSATQRIRQHFGFLCRLLVLTVRMACQATLYYLFPSRRTLAPCKFFNRKKALACYRLVFDPKNCKFDHLEIYRIASPTQGEYYLFSAEALQKKVKWHVSYHKSGAFHWRQEDGSIVVPRDGEADLRRAALLNQAIHHLTGRLDGYCLAVGPKVSGRMLTTMMSILDGYILPPLEVAVDLQRLLDQRHTTIIIPPTPHLKKAGQITDRARRENRLTNLSRDDIIASLTKKGIPKSRVHFTDPVVGTYVSCPENVMNDLLQLAGDLVSGKMQERPPEFWTQCRETERSSSNTEKVEQAGSTVPPEEAPGAASDVRY